MDVVLGNLVGDEGVGDRLDVYVSSSKHKIGRMVDA